MLRAVAAALVVFHHAAGIVTKHNAHASWLATSKLSLIGAAGVDIFFAISGFIMFYTTGSKEGSSQAWDFFFKRVIRIYPLYWVWTSVLLLIALFVVHPNHHHGPGFFVASYLLIPVFNGFNFHPFLDQGWTLSYEMFFYCVFAVGIWRVRRKSIIRFLGVAFLALFLLGFFLPADTGIKYLLSNTLIIEFLFGVVLAKLLLRRSNTREWKLASDWTSAGTVVLGMSLLVATTFIPGAGAWLTDSPWRFLFWGVPSALIVYGFASWNQNATSRTLIYLGDASYSTYLAHNFFLGIFLLMSARFAILQRIPADLEIIMLVVLTILLTLPGYQWIERPLTALLRFSSPVARAGVVQSSLHSS
jgi:peptidoglycan/LPS O-acetylase OafA/YrhL